MHLIKSQRLKVEGNQLLEQGIFGGQSREAQPDPWLFREAELGSGLCAWQSWQRPRQSL